jgi:formylglycine-generating enzyme required for sulfatase activity
MNFPRPFVERTLLVVVCLLPIASGSSPVWAQTQAAIKTRINAKDGLIYVWIPPGTFQMGCSTDDPACRSSAISGVEEPAHSVTITKGFWIGQK